MQVLDSVEPQSAEERTVAAPSREASGRSEPGGFASGGARTAQQADGHSHVILRGRLGRRGGQVAHVPNGDSVTVISYHDDYALVNWGEVQGYARVTNLVAAAEERVGAKHPHPRSEQAVAVPADRVPPASCNPASLHLDVARIKAELQTAKVKKKMQEAAKAVEDAQATLAEVMQQEQQDIEGEQLLLEALASQIQARQRALELRGNRRPDGSEAGGPSTFEAAGRQQERTSQGETNTQVLAGPHCVKSSQLLGADSKGRSEDVEEGRFQGTGPAHNVR